MHLPLPRRGLLLLVSSFTAASLACGGIPVGSQAAPDADFSRYKSYDWLIGAPESPGGIPIAPEELDAMIREAVVRELTAHGYKRATARKPDFLVWVHAAADDRERRTSVHRDRAGGNVSAAVTYRRGTLALEIVDASTGDIVFRGWAEAPILRGVAMDERRERIDDIVKRILDELPES